MRFTADMIEAARDADQEEAALAMEQANREDDQRARLGRIRSEPTFERDYPRMVAQIKADVITLPDFEDDAHMETYLAQYEALLKNAGAPLPGQETAPKAPESAAEEPGHNPKVIPWSETASQEALHPAVPGQGATELTAVVAEVEELMDPEPGKFTRGRQRDFHLIKQMMIANAQPGGSTAMNDVARSHEDPDVFPFSDMR